MVLAISLLPSRPLTRSLLTVTGIVLLYSAIWFVVLQLVVLKAICPWCMVEHGLGMAMALIILIGYRPRTAADQSGDSKSRIGSEAFWVEEIIVDPSINDIDTLKASSGGHPDVSVMHNEITTLDKFNTHLLCQEGMFEIR